MKRWKRVSGAEGRSREAVGRRVERGGKRAGERVCENQPPEVEAARDQRKMQTNPQFH